MEQRLYEAVEGGKVEKVRKILQENPEINVNWRGVNRRTALHVACNNGNDKITSLLLAHPDIDVNQKSNGGWTPFIWVCFQGRTSCARLLLKDARVEVNEPEDDGHTPLWHAARWGRLEVIKLWIASGREMDLGQPGDEKTDAIGEAKKLEPHYTRDLKKNTAESVTLLERFKANPEQTRAEVAEDEKKVEDTGGPSNGLRRSARIGAQGGK